MFCRQLQENINIGTLSLTPYITYKIMYVVITLNTEPNQCIGGSINNHLYILHSQIVPCFYIENQKRVSISSYPYHGAQNSMRASLPESVISCLKFLATATFKSPCSVGSGSLLKQGATLPANTSSTNCLRFSTLKIKILAMQILNTCYHYLIL